MPAASVRWQRPLARARSLSTVTTHDSSSSNPSKRALPFSTINKQLLRRVFAVDVLTCPDCGGARRLIAMITDGLVGRRILDHLDRPSSPPPIAPARAPPQPEFAW
jgi:hypothetical protein